MRLRLLLLLLLLRRRLLLAGQQMGLCVISEETQASQTRRSRRGRHQRWRCLVHGRDRRSESGLGRGMGEHYHKAEAEGRIGTGSLGLARVDMGCGREGWTRIKQFKQLLEAGIGNRWARWKRQCRGRARRCSGSLITGHPVWVLGVSVPHVRRPWHGCPRRSQRESFRGVCQWTDTKVQSEGGGPKNRTLEHTL